jgi:chemotaxis protein methyltransferase CheR
MRAKPVPEALWPRLSELIAESTGLSFPPERRSDLQRGLTGAATEFGFADAAACADWLLSAPLTASQLNTLASHLTIGETYFFRERNTFDALAQHVLPELIRRRAGERRLRLWSAACATGEEPYSLTILLQDVLPDWRDWRISILATDINPRFLQKAAAGVYGEWSFRDAPPGLKERHFIPAGEGRYAILPHVRQCVSFMHLNLAQDSFPSLATDTNAMDVILCRNVMIYFAPAQLHALVGKLRQALVDEGWLAVSPAEYSQAVFSSFASVNFPGTVIYRKTACAGTAPAAWTRPAEGLQQTAPPFPPQPQPPELRAAPEYTSDWTRPAAPDEPTLLSARPDNHGPVALAADARALANEGHLEKARDAAERWISGDKLEPAAHYLHAMILQELGDADGARRSLQRAVYLDSGFALAHFALGNVARNGGDARGAQRHYENTLAALRDRPPAEPLPESDGLSAGRLVEIVGTLMGLSRGVQ